MPPRAEAHRASYIRRRKFLATLLGGAAAALPLAARAQQRDGMRRIGVFMARAEDNPQARLSIEGFAQRLRQLGWIEGRNVQIDYRWGPATPAALAAPLRNLSRSRRTSSSALAPRRQWRYCRLPVPC